MSKRPKHKAPALFGERMRLVNTYEGRSVWARSYGVVSVSIVHYEADKTFPYHWSFGSYRDGFADRLSAAQRQLESLIRRTGLALPAAALVSRSEHAELVRMGHRGVTRYFRG